MTLDATHQAAHGLLIRRAGAVLILSHNNIAVRNALSPGFCQTVTAELKKAALDPAVGVVVLTGEGGHFCSGGDLRRLAKSRELPIEARRANLEILHDLIRTIRGCAKPVIAAVEGAAAGAGLSLALACDLLVAARNAKFSVAYIKVGLTPDGGATAFLAEFVSRQLLTELCLTGERIDGARLHALGAVNRLTEPGQALDAALALAERIVRGPLQATTRIKDLCWQASHNDLAQQLQAEAHAMLASQTTDESHEGMRAFLEKRPADFVSLRAQPLTVNR